MVAVALGHNNRMLVTSAAFLLSLLISDLLHWKILEITLSEKLLRYAAWLKYLACSDILVNKYAY